MTSADLDLREVLLEARELGFLGPGGIDTHLRHAEAFAAAARHGLGRAPSEFLDLGAGGGIPGLVLAREWPTAGGALVEAAARRCVALRRWIAQLGWGDRVTVLEGRAETWAHDPAWRERVDVVTARGFGRPAVVAEIGTGFARVGGVLVVSEPPGDDPSRWPPADLDELGFGRPIEVAGPAGRFAVVPKTHPAPADVPRGVGRPGKRPRW